MPQHSFRFAPGDHVKLVTGEAARILQSRWYPDGNWYLLNYRASASGSFDQKLVREMDIEAPSTVAPTGGLLA